MQITCEKFIWQCKSEGSFLSDWTSAKPWKHNPKANAHCKIVLIMVDIGFVSADRKHLKENFKYWLERTSTTMCCMWTSQKVVSWSRKHLTFRVINSQQTLLSILKYSQKHMKNSLPPPFITYQNFKPFKHIWNFFWNQI